MCPTRTRSWKLKFGCRTLMEKRNSSEPVQLCQCRLSNRIPATAAALQSPSCISHTRQTSHPGAQQSLPPAHARPTCSTSAHIHKSHNIRWRHSARSVEPGEHKYQQPQSGTTLILPPSDSCWSFLQWALYRCRLRRGPHKRLCNRHGSLSTGTKSFLALIRPKKFIYTKIVECHWCWYRESDP
jgi:hypothetical protein